MFAEALEAQWLNAGGVLEYASVCSSLDMILIDLHAGLTSDLNPGRGEHNLWPGHILSPFIITMIDNATQ